ncbi:unnamed protein product [Ilex paraguariensis]|uniref:Uncharacterized protein n=1 Tax=Ilex paraguariensis TaxID=185542 RepID=A0ABC8SDC0_9AQUA
MERLYHLGRTQWKVIVWRVTVVIGKELNATRLEAHVIKLSLNSTRDRLLGDWYFNASLFLPFKELQNLDLSDNQPVGWFANEAGFERLSGLSKLEILRLDWNRYDNSVLSSLGVLSSLKRLYMSNSQLNRSVHLQGMKETLAIFISQGELQ